MKRFILILGLLLMAVSGYAQTDLTIAKGDTIAVIMTQVTEMQDYDSTYVALLPTDTMYYKVDALFFGDSLVNVQPLDTLDFNDPPVEMGINSDVNNVVGVHFLDFIPVRYVFDNEAGFKYIYGDTTRLTLTVTNDTRPPKTWQVIFKIF